jgi:hypothetical protein
MYLSSRVRYQPLNEKIARTYRMQAVVRLLVVTVASSVPHATPCGCVACGAGRVVVGGVGWVERVVVSEEAWIGIHLDLRPAGNWRRYVFGGFRTGRRRRGRERENVDTCESVLVMRREQNEEILTSQCSAVLANVC